MNGKNDTRESDAEGKLPLSGSLLDEGQHVVQEALTMVFQLPLSGSLLSGMGLTEGVRLSTPSLGITSPIPGFSGSPRLSAAAPFRTNEF
jgi:hypothetical protein